MPAVRQVQRSRVLAGAQEQAWRALTEPHLASAWLGARPRLDLRVAGSRGTLTDPDGTVRRVVVEEVEPPHRLVLRWAGDRGQAAEPSRVEVTLAPETGERTRVTVTEIALADAPEGLT